MKRVLLLVLGSATTLACIWDSDTLGMEMKKFPGLTQVITGRFERNPPLYYQIRLERVTKELQTSSDRLELYDDAGAACDRLGRSDEAIAWMAKKRAILDRAPNKEHLYRYHANLGTFLAHKWFRDKDRKDPTLLVQGRDHIAKAIEINPDAHFGREMIQLAVMDWALSKPGEGRANNYDGPRDIGDFFYQSAGEASPKDLVKGLAGLVVLGNAWESVDVYTALSEALAYKDASIAALAALRVEELLRNGGKSIDPEFTFDEYNVGRHLRDEGSEVKKHYTALRQEADDWAAKREAYMMVRLKQGRHPDTDSGFWSEWKDSGPPQIPLPAFSLRSLNWPGIAIIGTACLLIAASIFAYVKSSRKQASRPA